LALLGFLALALGAGALGAFVSPGQSPTAADWYGALVKPAWAPPNAWFAPVWAVLYVLMSVAGWLVWHERYHHNRVPALAAYAVQLSLNAAWAPLFFGWRNVGAGLFDVVALWVAIAWTVREFARVRPAAAWLLAPYLVWVGFAAALNFNLWRANP
jgi:tryptophan-rich sensory protein